MTRAQTTLVAVIGAAVMVAAAFVLWAYLRAVNEQREHVETFQERLETMVPEDRGLAPTPSFPSDFLKVTLKLSRRDHQDAERAHTVIALDRDAMFTLPRGWRGRLEETAARVGAYDAVFDEVRAAVHRRMQAHGGDPADVRGEIVAAPPHGDAVPHADIVGALNVLLGLGMVDVVFEGASTPLTEAQRADRASQGEPVEVTIRLARDGIATLGDAHVDLAPESTPALRATQRKALAEALAKHGVALPHDPAAHPETTVRVRAANGTRWAHAERLLALLHHADINLHRTQMSADAARADDDR